MSQVGGAPRVAVVKNWRDSFNRKSAFAYDTPTRDIHRKNPSAYRLNHHPGNSNWGGAFDMYRKSNFLRPDLVIISKPANTTAEILFLSISKSVFAEIRKRSN